MRVNISNPLYAKLADKNGYADIEDVCLHDRNELIRLLHDIVPHLNNFRTAELVYDAMRGLARQTDAIEAHGVDPNDLPEGELV